MENKNMLKAILAVFMCIGLAIQPAFSASSNEAISLEGFFVECDVEPDVSKLTPVFENIGVDVEEIEFVEQTEESCTVTIKGSIDGREIEVTITFEGVSCAELLEDLM